MGNITRQEKEDYLETMYFIETQAESGYAERY